MDNFFEMISTFEKKGMSAEDVKYYLPELTESRICTAMISEHWNETITDKNEMSTLDHVYLDRLLTLAKGDIEFALDIVAIRLKILLLKKIIIQLSTFDFER